MVDGVKIAWNIAIVEMVENVILRLVYVAVPWTGLDQNVNFHVKR